MLSARICLGVLLAASLNLRAEEPPKPLYENNFEKAAVGKVPDEFLVLGGEFAVKEEGGNKFLELPGEPNDSFGVLFGPTEAVGLSVKARIFGTSKGRRSPVFGVGLNGANGHWLRVSPQKEELELVKEDEPVKAVPFKWKPGSWVCFQMQVRETKPNEWVVEGKAWTEGDPEPKDWQLSLTLTEKPEAGRASVRGSPFANTPIRFDDLAVTRIK